MVALEYWVRLIRVPFVIGFAIAAYLTLINVATGWERTFFFVMLWPFAVATLILEILQLNSVLQRKKQQ